MRVPSLAATALLTVVSLAPAQTTGASAYPGFPQGRPQPVTTYPTTYVVPHAEPSPAPAPTGQQAIRQVGAELSRLPPADAMRPVVTPTSPAPRYVSSPSELCPPACPTCPEPGCDLPRVWVRGEYLYWTLQGSRVPSLLTESPVGTNQANAGVLGTPGTVSLFGNDRINDGWRSGFRADAGVWLCDGAFGLQGGFFRLQNGNDSNFGGSDGTRVLSRPYVDGITGLPAAQLVSFPGLLAGFSTVEAASTGVMGAEGLLRCPICCDTHCEGSSRFDFITGYRFFALDDRLTILENLDPIGAPFVPGSNFLLTDSFATRNRFHGGVVGIGWNHRYKSITLEANARADIGYMNREVTIQGTTVQTVPGAPSFVSNGGLFAQPSNNGRYTSSDLTVIPEFDGRIGWQPGKHVRFTIGYSAILLTNVARAGEQIDTRVNRNQLPPNPQLGVGPQVPVFSLNRSDCWLHGATAGVELFY